MNTTDQAAPNIPRVPLVEHAKFRKDQNRPADSRSRTNAFGLVEHLSRRLSGTKRVYRSDTSADMTAATRRAAFDGGEGTRNLQRGVSSPRTMYIARRFSRPHDKENEGEGKGGQTQGQLPMKETTGDDVKGDRQCLLSVKAENSRAGTATFVEKDHQGFGTPLPSTSQWRRPRSIYRRGRPAFSKDSSHGRLVYTRKTPASSSCPTFPLSRSFNLDSPGPVAAKQSAVALVLSRPQPRRSITTPAGPVLTSRSRTHTYSSFSPAPSSLPMSAVSRQKTHISPPSATSELVSAKAQSQFTSHTDPQSSSPTPILSAFRSVSESLFTSSSGFTEFGLDSDDSSPSPSPLSDLERQIKDISLNSMTSSPTKAVRELQVLRRAALESQVRRMRMTRGACHPVRKTTGEAMGCPSSAQAVVDRSFSKARGPYLMPSPGGRRTRRAATSPTPSLLVATGGRPKVIYERMHLDITQAAAISTTEVKTSRSAFQSQAMHTLPPLDFTTKATKRSGAMFKSNGPSWLDFDFSSYNDELPPAAHTPPSLDIHNFQALKAESGSGSPCRGPASTHPSMTKSAPFLCSTQAQPQVSTSSRINHSKHARNASSIDRWLLTLPQPDVGTSPTLSQSHSSGGLLLSPTRTCASIAGQSERRRLPHSTSAMVSRISLQDMPESHHQRRKSVGMVMNENNARRASVGEETDGIRTRVSVAASRSSQSKLVLDGLDDSLMEDVFGYLLKP